MRMIAAGLVEGDHHNTTKATNRVGAILPTGDPLPTTGQNRRHGTAAATLRQQFGLEEAVIIKKKT